MITVAVGRTEGRRARAKAKTSDRRKSDRKAHRCSPAADVVADRGVLLEYPGTLSEPDERNDEIERLLLLWLRRLSLLPSSIDLNTEALRDPT